MFHTLFSVLLAVGTSSSPAHQRGVDLYKSHKYSEAITSLTEAAQAEDPKSADFQESALLIGQSYFMLSQAPKAIPWLEKVRRANEANYMLGYAYLQENRPAESRLSFARLFGLDPNSPSAHLMAAQMMIKKQYEDQALVEIRKAIELDPKLPEAHFLFGEISIYQGRLEEGIAALNAEITLNPNFSMSWYRRGDALYAPGKVGPSHRGPATGCLA